MKKTTKLLALPVMASALFLSASLTWAASTLPLSISEERIQTEARAWVKVGEYSIDVRGNGDCAITGYSGSETDLAIPAELDKHPVKEIAAETFRGNSSIQSVTLPDALETVGRYAFGYCRALTSVSLNEGLTTIGEGAFSGCSQLTELSFPTTLETVEKSAFSNCSNLSEVSMNEGLTTIGESAFSSCNQLKSITFPDSLTSIGWHSFSSCERLESVTFPASITSLGGSAFYRCKALKNVDFSKADQLKTIQQDTFRDCSSLERIELPKNLEEIGLLAFGSCGNLKEVVFPEGLKKIHDRAFQHCRLQTLNLPDSVTEIHNVAFEGSRFTEIRIPKNWSNNNAGNTPFFECPIASIEIPDGMKIIPKDAFYSKWEATKKTVETFSFPASLTSIEENAFRGLTMLKEIRIYKSKVAIKSNAFDVNSVNEAWLGWRLDSIADDAFTNRHDAFTICGASGSYAQTYADRNGINFEAKDIDLNNCSLMLSPDSFVYDGTAKESAFTIAGAEEKLLEFMGCEPGVNYNVSYEDNVNAGTASVTVTAIPGRGYTGSCTASFTIEPRPISDSQAEFGAYNKVYDGTAKEPSIQLTCGGAALQAGQDYSIIGYENNIQAGNASAKVEGTGNYTGQHTHTFTIDPKPLEEGWSALSLTDFTYDGTAKEPVVTVTDGQISFIQNKDYEVSYQENLHAGEASATVTGIGNYSGKFTYTYKINPKSLSEEMIRLQEDHLAYDGSPKTPQAIVTDNGQILKEGEAYTVEYRDNIEIGTAQIVLTGKGDYTGTASASFQITERVSHTVTAQLSATNYTYDGTAKTPGITVEIDGQTLPAGQYQVTYRNNTNAGIAQAIISGQNIGTIERNFTIWPASIANFQAETGSYDPVYDGTAKTPALQLKNNGIILTPDVDYKITAYENNIHAGTASVKAQGTGNYTGAKECAYVIQPKPLKDDMIQLSETRFIYNGSPKTPQAIVTDNGQTLKEGKAYTVEYRDNTEIGTAQVILTGIGDYAETASASFKIEKEAPRQATAELSETDFIYDGTEKKPAATVQIDGQTLPEDQYQIAYENNINAGYAKAIITGESIEPLELDFAIRPAPIASLRLAKTRFIYDGQAKKPAATVTGNGCTLKPGQDYQIEYKNNTNAGYAQAVATGTGNYEGIVHASFQIEKAASRIDLPKKSYRISYSTKPFSLKATLKGDGRLSYSTDKTSVAKVSAKGTITAKRPGTARITIQSKGTANYAGTKATVSITVTPKRGQIKKAKSLHKSLQISWKKDLQASGYQILTATDKNFKKQKGYVNIRKKRTSYATVKKLKARNNYYIKIRSYKTVNGKKIYGPYSKVLRKKTK